MLNRIKGKKTILSLIALLGVFGLTLGESTTSQGKAPTIDMREAIYQEELTNLEEDLEESDTEESDTEESDTEEASQLRTSKNESDSQIKVNVTD